MVTGGKEENMHEDFTGKVQIDTPSFEADALKGFSRTIDEIQWLLVVLVLLYQIVQGREDESAASIYYGLLLYSVFIAGFRYFYVIRDESRWKLAISPSERWRLQLNDGEQLYASSLPGKAPWIACANVAASSMSGVEVSNHSRSA